MVHTSRIPPVCWGHIAQPSRTKTCDDSWLVLSPRDRVLINKSLALQTMDKYESFLCVWYFRFQCTHRSRLCECVFWCGMPQVDSIHTRHSYTGIRLVMWLLPCHMKMWCRWFSIKLLYLHCVSNVDTAVLYIAIDLVETVECCTSNTVCHVVFPVELIWYNSSNNINTKYPKPQPQSAWIKENTACLIPREKIQCSNRMIFTPPGFYWWGHFGWRHRVHTFYVTIETPPVLNRRRVW